MKQYGKNVIFMVGTVPPPDYNIGVNTPNRKESP
jgi:hypothetical protein